MRWKKKSSLEAIVAAGLSWYGDDRHELARWVVTGKGSVNTNTIGYGPDNDIDAWRAMVDEVGQAPPMVEWRLTELVTLVGPRRRPLVAILSLRRPEPPSDTRIAELLAAIDIDEQQHLRLLFPTKWTDWAADLRRRPAFSRMVHDHPDVVASELDGAYDIDRVVDALEDATDDAVAPLASKIAELAADPIKKRRIAGTRLARRVHYQLLEPEFKRLVTGADPRVRAEAVTAWGRRAEPDHLAEVVEFCQRYRDEAPPAVRTAIAELDELARQDAAALMPSPSLIRRLRPAEAPLGDDERVAFVEIFDRFFENRQATYDAAQQYLLAGTQHRQWHWANRSTAETPQPTPQAVIDASENFLRTGANPNAMFGFLADQTDRTVPIPKAFNTVHTFRWMWLRGEPIRRNAALRTLIERYQTTGHPTPLECQAAAESAGYHTRDVIIALLDRTKWSRELLGEWASVVLPDLLDTIEAGTVASGDRIDSFYYALSTLPELPFRVHRVLELQAVGPRRLRPLARSVLAEYPGVIETATAFLSSKKADERAAAAGWLGELHAIDAIPALQRAAKIEKNDVVLGTELSVLERLGEPVDRFIDPDELKPLIAKELKKGMPAAGAWIRLDEFPELIWNDGKVVDPQLVAWLVTQSVRAKSGSPSPIVRRLFDRMQPTTVAAFTAKVFDAWIEQDLRPTSTEEATASAVEYLKRPWRPPEYQGLTDREVIAAEFKRLTTNPADSAVAAKGLLGLVAAGADGSVIAPAEAYIRQWSGSRTSQCKSMIEMLAWIDDPAAVRFVLSVARRFRAKSLQAEAERQAELLAERNGWTVEELADRSVPTGGFDAAGTLIVDYDDRTFTARLADDLTVDFVDDSGKTLKSLPAPRKSEDADWVKQAKREVNDAKKQIATAAAEQTARLREAMYVQRRFPTVDFAENTLEHPLMRRLATRLVWAAVGPEQRILFRPLSDGTLLDVDDNEVDITTAEHVTVAHEAIDGRQVGTAWLAHLSDYGIVPLFAQFDRPVIDELAEFDEGQLAWTGCRGATIDRDELTSVASALGFEVTLRIGFGESSISKHPTSQIEARIPVRAPGSPNPDTDVVLDSLRFVDADGFEDVPLCRLPRVVLVETIADVQQIMAAGHGIDPDWERRVLW